MPASTAHSVTGTSRAHLSASKVTRPNPFDIRSKEGATPAPPMPHPLIAKKELPAQTPLKVPTKMLSSAPLPGPQPIEVPAVHGPIVVRSTKYTETELRAMLADYEQLPRAQWGNIKYKQHIRYVRRVGHTFVRGGFVVGIITQDDRPALTIATKLNPRGPGYYAWVIMLDDIETLFVKKMASSAAGTEQ